MIELALTSGPEKALARYQQLSETRPDFKDACHGNYHVIGRKVALALGLPEYRDIKCQFGFTHGVLYAMGETYKSASALLDDLRTYCDGFRDSDLESTPYSSCMHGMGHAAAEASPRDPLAAIKACARLSAAGRENCSDGVFMQYGDDNLRTVGYLNPEGRELDDGAVAPPKEIVALCPQLPAFAQQACYHRKWKFLVTGPDADPVEVATVCLTAPDPKLIRSCYLGVGELVSFQVIRQMDVYPPRTKEEAVLAARAMVRFCTAMALPDICLKGTVGGLVSHLYAVDTPEELVPNPCPHVTADLKPACLDAMQRARELNWDKVVDPQDHSTS